MAGENSCVWLVVPASEYRALQRQVQALHPVRLQLHIYKWKYNGNRVAQH